MIQRIQTLYLTIALGLMATLLFGIYATYTPFVVLTVAVCALLVLTIFLYKARKIQIRLCIYTSLIMLGQQIWMGVAYYQNKALVSFTVSTVFPIISIILVLLALRAIAADEALVQSYNRLRPGKGKGKGKK
ncbi:MAG: DUF4293 domain-containing protein [Bacteroidales bacterium]|jgi:hypothetical protein|nr:DUF4293 domain-containing protein [Bacteroidales bacterium]NLK79806.1 DUF4293 domain-containing protein [Bacteroidales bacterium]HKM31848.1 DUF4293 domain-containing protein [Bacteroidales bacterium]HPX79912.1 DUF4293 domain-containing protein [Bacteroidales bacterium]HQB24145.1 DUF4293 domain-containing protein [Bacteroidales bacterium]